MRCMKVAKSTKRKGTKKTKQVKTPLSSATSVRQEAVTSPRKRARFLLRCVTAALPTTRPILLARDLNVINERTFFL